MTIVNMTYRTQSVSVFSSLDDVPFVVSDKYKPPPKVTLPLKFEMGNPSEILFMEYDTSLEEKIVAQLEMYRASEAAAAEAARHKSPEAAAAATASGSSETISEVDNCPPVSSDSSQSGQQQNGPPCKIQNMGPGDSRTAFGMMNNADILMPTPITAPSGGRSRDGVDSGLRNIDISDFENEQDPFENLSLRVMNDREELNKIFHVDGPPLSRPTNQPAVSAVGSQNVGVAGRNTGIPPSNPAVKPVAIGNGPSAALLQYAGPGNINGLASSNFVPCQQVPRWPAATDHDFSSGGAFNSPGHVPGYPSGAAPSGSVSFMPSGSVSYAMRPEPISPQLPLSTTALRSAKSTPDISALADEWLATASSLARRTPPPVSHVERSSLWTSEETRTSNGYSSVMRPSAAKPVNNSSTTAASARASSAYLSLAPEAKTFVDNISAMGFNLEDVTQTVKKLGMDDKLVLDHLCLLGQLTDKGFLSSDAANALSLFENDLEKAEIYLTLSQKLTELGFPRDRIQDALISSDLDENKSIDLLVGS